MAAATPQTGLEVPDDYLNGIVLGNGWLEGDKVAINEHIAQIKAQNPRNMPEIIAYYRQILIQNAPRDKQAAFTNLPEPTYCDWFNITQESLEQEFEAYAATALSLGWSNADLDTIKKVIIRDEIYPLDKEKFAVIQGYLYLISEKKPGDYVAPIREGGILKNALTLSSIHNREVQKTYILKLADLINRVLGGHGQQDLDTLGSSDRIKSAFQALMIPGSALGVGGLLGWEASHVLGTNLSMLLGGGIAGTYTVLDTAIVHKMRETTKSPFAARALLKSVRTVIAGVVGLGVVGGAVATWKEGPVRDTYLSSRINDDPSLGSIRSRVATTSAEIVQAGANVGDITLLPSQRTEATKKLSALEEARTALQNEEAKRIDELTVEMEKAYGVLERIMTSYKYLYEKADNSTRSLVICLALLLYSLDLFGLIINAIQSDPFRKIDQKKRAAELREGLEKLIQTLQEETENAHQAISHEEERVRSEKQKLDKELEEYRVKIGEEQRALDQEKERLQKIISDINQQLEEIEVKKQQAIKTQSADVKNGVEEVRTKLREELQAEKQKIQSEIDDLQKQKEEKERNLDDKIHEYERREQERMKKRLLDYGVSMGIDALSQQATTLTELLGKLQSVSTAGDDGVDIAQVRAHMEGLIQSIKEHEGRIAKSIDDHTGILRGDASILAGKAQVDINTRFNDTFIPRLRKYITEKYDLKAKKRFMIIGRERIKYSLHGIAESEIRALAADCGVVYYDDFRPFLEIALNNQ